jgi:hypothetical protein
MMHRFGPAFAVVAGLVFPFTAQAQVAPTASWAGPARPPTWNAQPAYPATRYAQPTYPPTYVQPAVAAHASSSFTPTPTPAAYAYNGYPAAYPPYAAQYPGSPTGYGQSYPATGGSWAAPGREAPAPGVQTKDSLHYVQMGVGSYIPTDSGNPAKVGVEANVWALRGGLVPNSGLYLTLDASTGFDVGCIAKSASDGCKGHFRIHWIGAGPFFNTARPMIASDVPRSWDLMAFTGAEVRLWKGMTVKTTVNWFLPSPWGVYAHYKEQAEARLTGAASAISTSTPGASTMAAEALDPAVAAKNVFGHALGHPQINVMALWEF